MLRPAALLCAALLVCSALEAVSSRQNEVEMLSSTPRKPRQRRSHNSKDSNEDKYDDVLVLMPRKDVYKYKDNYEQAK